MSISEAKPKEFKFEGLIVYQTPGNYKAIPNAVPIVRDSSGAPHNLMPLMELAKVNYAKRLEKMAEVD